MKTFKTSRRSTVLIPALALLALGIVSMALPTTSKARSAPSTTSTVEVVLQDFDEDTGLLTVNIDGVAPPAWFLHTGATIHVANPPLLLFPPNPCDGLITAFNIQVERTQGGKNPVPAFIAIIDGLASHQCSAMLTIDDSTSPATITEFQPLWPDN